MLVAEKKHHIESHIYGRGADYLVSILKKTLPDLEVINENDPESDEELIDSDSSEWYLEMEEEMTPGVKLRLRRENKGLTQTELSDMTGIAIPNISLMEKDKRNIGLKTAKKLASALGCNAADFIF